LSLHLHSLHPINPPPWKTWVSKLLPELQISFIPVSAHFFTCLDLGRLAIPCRVWYCCTAYLLRYDRSLLARRLKAGPDKEKEKVMVVRILDEERLLSAHLNSYR